MPIDVIPRLVAAGLLHAVLWVPVAVFIFGKRKPDPLTPTTGHSVAIAPGPWAWRLALNQLRPAHGDE